MSVTSFLTMRHAHNFLTVRSYRYSNCTDHIRSRRSLSISDTLVSVIVKQTFTSVYPLKPVLQDPGVNSESRRIKSILSAYPRDTVDIKGTPVDKRLPCGRSFHQIHCSPQLCCFIRRGTFSLIFIGSLAAGGEYHRRRQRRNYYSFIH